MYKSNLYDVLHVNDVWASVSIISPNSIYAPCTGACPEKHRIIESFIAYLSSIFFYKLVSHQNGKMEISQSLISHPMLHAECAKSLHGIAYIFYKYLIKEI